MTLLDMENKESILAALSDLEPDGKPPAILEEYLREIAKHGLTFIPWIHIKPLILLKFNHIMDEFIENVDESLYQNVLRPTSINDLRERVYKILSKFEGTPFTIQRICELLSDPRKHYTRPDKFLRGFEKVCLVVSTVDAYGNKIHNVEPRLSGTIERSTSFILNGTSVESGSNEDSSSRSKPSEDEEDEDTDDVSSPKRPCINLYRRSTSKLVDGLQKSFGSDSLIGAYSPGIPGKHTLQRPFLSGRGSSTIPINTIFEDVETSVRGTPGADMVDDDDDNSSNSDDGGEGEMKREGSEGEGCISEERETSLTQQHPLTGIQKLFMECDEEDTDMLISPVPSIEQILRPMGQLEAFVNTISMVTANPPSSTVSHPVSGDSDNSLLSTPNSAGCGSTPENKNKGEEAEDIEIPFTEILLPENGKEEEKSEKQDEGVENQDGNGKVEEKKALSLSSVASQPSLKRRDVEDSENTDLDANLTSPAKRIRVDGEQEFTDIEFSESTLVQIDYEVKGISRNSAESASDEDSNEAQLSSDDSQSSIASKERVHIDHESEAPTSTVKEPQEQLQTTLGLDADVGELLK